MTNIPASSSSVRILGIDPGLRRMGWGVILYSDPDEVSHNLQCLGCGVVQISSRLSLPERLSQLFTKLNEILDAWLPHHVAIENAFVSRFPVSTLNLGLARGVITLAPALRKMPISIYTPNQIKKTVSGFGHTDKDAMHSAVLRVVQHDDIKLKDTSDALAVALTHVQLNMMKQ